MLSPAEIDRLPDLLRDIVMADRTLEIARRAICRPVVTIAVAQLYQRRTEHRRDLTRAAATIWGHSIRGDGTAPC